MLKASFHPRHDGGCTRCLDRSFNKWRRRMSERSDVEWDYIVVGAGSAGCALTHELVTDTRKPRVLVLEAGGADRSPYIRLQAGAFQACLSHDWGYRAQPDPTRRGLIERWWRGRVLGGCSSINSTIYVRGAA